ncbi:hypothetical protein HPB50_025397 [Hyalomma asiaticum]|uniref:Uncharacterized protein n=1 Tax=Hyalomma asiaticum TaxID=266040 RepID=A0ACB7S2V0_HYAAI|nr:hypothetical protein HPB50_025397 [Hyalomma asiaticum]
MQVGFKLWAQAGESGPDFDVYPASSKGFYRDQGGYELGLEAGHPALFKPPVKTTSLLVTAFFQVLTR